jgi:hypothetical protein
MLTGFLWYRLSVMQMPTAAIHHGLIECPQCLLYLYIQLIFLLNAGILDDNYKGFVQILRGRCMRL